MNVPTFATDHEAYGRGGRRVRLNGEGVLLGEGTPLLAKDTDDRWRLRPPAPEAAVEFEMDARLCLWVSNRF